MNRLRSLHFLFPIFSHALDFSTRNYALRHALNDLLIAQQPEHLYLSTLSSHHLNSDSTPRGHLPAPTRLPGSTLIAIYSPTNPSKPSAQVTHSNPTSTSQTLSLQLGVTVQVKSDGLRSNSHVPTRSSRFRVRIVLVQMRGSFV